MALAESPIPLSGPDKSWRRLFRFLGRVMLAVWLASASIGFITNQAERFNDERHFEYPLTVAMERLGVAVSESEVLVVAPIENGPIQSLSRLKEIASRVARAMPGFDEANFWTEAGDTYLVVYFEGVEPSGGRWVVSTRFIPGDPAAGHLGREGSVEATVLRSFLGVPGQIAQMARSTKGLVERAVGRPLNGTEATVRLRGRPPQEAGREEVARGLLSEVGADLRYESSDSSQYVAAGLTPRLAGRAQLGRQTVNVVVSVSRHGIGQWVEVESPALQ